jgi:hypothetical protein
MTSLSQTVGDDVPTLDEVREKIEARYAKAKGMSELSDTSVESRMLEIEQASMNRQAQTRLDEIRVQLGIAPAEEAAGEVGAGSNTAANATTATPQPAQDQQAEPGTPAT